ncbi:MAG: desulfoferrodoxin [SAR202 cluster bacterium]|mgnify:CR=1 FL=1|nr:desulfoferrodoxin [SAR202 cluster bacterium]
MSDTINKTGTRLICISCGAEFVVTRAGNGELTCCETPLDVKEK